MICPSCLTKYADDATTCEADGTALVPEAALVPAEKEIAVGDAVGEYRIEGKLGEGGFGAVYRAVHPLIGKQAAVKVLSRQFSSNPEMVARFVSEARAVNQIRHPNIIDIFSFGQLPDGRRYYVMELLEGMPFDRWLAKHQRLSLADAAPILRGIARALDAAHGKGILHRDLKPENVFLVFREDGRIEPKLLDFGLVKLLTEPSGHEKTKTGTPMGTPYYMSPEQCRGLPCDRRTDVYAFGALVFEVLTGKVPFDGGSQMDILVKHMTEPPPAASSHVPELGPAVDAAIRRMMAKDREHRPGTVGDALDELLSAAGMSEPRSTQRLALDETLPIDPSASRPLGQGTFLGAETDVVPAKRSFLKPFVGVAGVGVLVVAGVLALRHRAEAPAEVTAKDAPSGLVSAPPIASAPPEPSVAPASSTVSLRVDGAPAGAIVLADGKELGPAPGPFEIARNTPTRITVRAKGYKPRDVEVAPTADVVLPVTLEKAVVAPPPKKRPPNLPSDLDEFDKQ